MNLTAKCLIPSSPHSATQAEFKSIFPARSLVVYVYAYYHEMRRIFAQHIHRVHDSGHQL